MSACRYGISRYRAKKKNIKTSKIGRDGGGKIMRKRKVYWECNGESVDSPVSKSKWGWV